MLATLLLAPAVAASPNFYWNVASANNSEIEANISASVSTIRFGQVRPTPPPLMTGAVSGPGAQHADGASRPLGQARGLSRR